MSKRVHIYDESSESIDPVLEDLLLKPKKPAVPRYHVYLLVDPLYNPLQAIDSSSPARSSSSATVSGHKRSAADFDSIPELNILAGIPLSHTLHANGCLQALTDPETEVLWRHCAGTMSKMQAGLMDVGVKPKLKDYIIPPPAPLIDAAEFGKWSFYRAIIAEFVATLLFLYITLATVIGASRNSGCAGVGILGIAWSFGGMIFVLVYCIAGISGNIKHSSTCWSFSSHESWIIRAI